MMRVVYRVLVTASFGLAGLYHAFTAYSKTAPNIADLPLTWTPFGFTTESISIGTPTQPQTAFVDWTWVGLYEITNLCRGQIKNPNRCIHPNQTIFDFSRSETYQNETNRYGYLLWNPNQFFFNDDLSAEIGTDVVRVSSHSAEIVVQLADLHFTQRFAYPFHAVYGLSPVFKADNASIQSPFYQMWKQNLYASSQISFIYCYTAAFDNPYPDRALCSGFDGVQTLGGHHNEAVRGEITWYQTIIFPMVNVLDFVYSPEFLQYWTVPVTKILIGNEAQGLNETFGAAAVFDHASYGRGVPLSQNSYDRLVRITHAVPSNLTKDRIPNNGEQSFFSVSCNEVSTFPSIGYEFGGSDRLWEVIPENYVEVVETESGPICVLNVRTLGGGGDFIIGNFGETFLKDKMIIMDFESLEVGLADIQKS